VEAHSYQFDHVEVRPATCEVLRDGSTVSLEPKAFRVLLYLIENRDRAVAKEELIGAVWDGAAVTDNALTRIVAQLRRELRDDARQARYIQTLPTLGYRFVGELRVTCPPPRAAAPTRKVRWIALGIGALTLALIAIVAHRGTTPGPAVRLRAVQLTTSPGIDFGASFSPDGNFFAFSSDRNGSLEIYKRPAASGRGHEVQITSNGKQNIEPVWSPDGKWIAFHSAAAHGIWIVPAAGGEAQQISSFGSAPAWAPNASTLAFRSAEPHSFAPFDLPGIGESTIWTVSSDGSGLRRLTHPQHPPGQHASPSWSPDGRRVLFNSWRSKSALWTVELSSGTLKEIPTGTVADPVRPLFGTGQSIYFVGRSRWGGFSIYYVRSAGAAPVELYEGSVTEPLKIAVSPDGRRLLYERCATMSQLWQSGGNAQPKALYRESVFRAMAPSFSPDGKRLAYLVRRQGARFELGMMNADGSGAAVLVATPLPQNGAGWSADGSAILFSHMEAEAIRLKRIVPETGVQRLLGQIKEPILLPQVTPDERDVVYFAGRPANIWTRSLAGGPARQLTFERESASFPRVSWDGQWIAFESRNGNNSQMKVMDRKGGKQVQLTDGEGLNWPNSWSADNRRIAFTSFHNGVWNVCWVDRVTKERKQITHETAFGSFVRNPAWRPGKEDFVYEHWMVKGNIYMADVQP